MTTETQTIQGAAASPGIAIGPVFCLCDPSIEIELYQAEPAAEWQRLETALQTASQELTLLRDKACVESGEEEAAIFDAQLLILQDPTLLEGLQLGLTDRRCNIETLWNEAIETNAGLLDAMQDEYFRARATDVRDIGRRVIRLLLGHNEVDLSALATPSIIVARDLTPSDTVRLDKSLVLGFCTAEGGPTAHSAILAKALGIPAVVAAGAAVLALTNGTQVVMDGGNGKIIVAPDAAELTALQAQKARETALAEEHQRHAHQPAITRDGRRVEVAANIGSAEDAARAVAAGAEGVGLLRTEFLYLDRSSAPDEEEQLAAYQAIFNILEDRPIVVRTLDVGGDKPLPYIDLGREENPFLGWRAVRMCLDNPDFFKVQLRALLRAGVGRDIRIMFPMIATLDEFRAAKALLCEARAALEASGTPCAGQVQTGIMVEIPSVAVLADLFAREVDFFSIGTNDLTQYTMAADRGNQKLTHLADACHPAVLRQIARVIECAHEAGIWVGLCGELGGDPDAAPILLGLGLDEFSMASSSIPRTKALIRNWSAAAAHELAAAALNMESGEQVRKFVRRESQSLT